MRTLPLSRPAVLVLVAALLATIFLPTRPAEAATAAPLPTVGVQVHAMWADMDAATLDGVLTELAASGVEWIRVDIGWTSLEEKCRGCYDAYWTRRIHEILDTADAHGLKVLATVWRTPKWANASGSAIAPPADPADYGRFARWFAGEFGADIDAYEVWNEPNQDDFFDGTPAQYASLLKASYAAFHAGDPTAPVVFGGPAYNDTDFIAAAYEAGAAGSFDIMSTHPYVGPADIAPETPDTDGDDIYLLTHVEAVQKLMAANGDADLPIWFTEFGWSSRGRDASLATWERGVTEAEQADYLVRTLDLVAERYPYVDNVFWYNARERNSGNARLDNYGLMRRDLTPKPALLALREKLNGSRSTTPTRTNSGAAAPTVDPAVAEACTDSDVSGSFSDLGNSVHGANVDCMAHWNVVKRTDGTSDGRFRIGDRADRAFIAAVVDRLAASAGKPLPKATRDHFSDDNGHVHEDAINRLAEAGLSTGFSDGTYRPNSSLTRAQMATLLAAAYRHLGYDVPGTVADAFDDDNGNVHEANINLAAELSVASGTSATTYSPGNTLTRGQLSTFAARLANHAAKNGATA